MSAGAFATCGTFQANTVQPALPGHWCCPLEGAAAEGRFGGELT